MGSLKLKLALVLLAAAMIVFPRCRGFTTSGASSANTWTAEDEANARARLRAGKLAPIEVTNLQGQTTITRGYTENLDSPSPGFATPESSPETSTRRGSSSSRGFSSAARASLDSTSGVQGPQSGFSTFGSQSTSRGSFSSGGVLPGPKLLTGIIPGGVSSSHLASLDSALTGQKTPDLVRRNSGRSRIQISQIMGSSDFIKAKASKPNERGCKSCHLVHAHAKKS